MRFGKEFDEMVAAGRKSGRDGLRIMSYHGVTGERLVDWAKAQLDDAEESIQAARIRRDSGNVAWFMGRISCLTEFVYR